MSPNSPSLSSHYSTWSILRSLDHLSPPSPDISLGQISTLCSSGEIPIILHSGVPTFLRTASSSSSTSLNLSPSLVRREPKELEGPTANEGNTATSPARSIRTIDTCGTFGPIRRDNKPNDSAILTSHDVPLLVSPEFEAVNYESSRPCESGEQDDFSQQDEPKLKVDSPAAEHDNAHASSVLFLDPFLAEREAISSTNRSVDSIRLRSPMDDGGQVLLMTPSQSFSALPTPIFAPPSPSYSLDTPESSPSRALKTKLRHAVNRGINFMASMHPHSLSPSSCPTSPISVRDRSESAPSSPVSSKSRSHHRSRGSTSTTHSTRSSRSAHSISIPTPVVPSSEDLMKFLDLPLALGWLKDTMVHLSIDQEGFRAIRPVFKLVGYSRPPECETAPISLNMHLNSAQADFMPLKRQSFIFHHATLDTPPILRRLTINGDESHDYISRQAYLCLRANGAYSVHGAESSHVDRHDVECTNLAWKFDYLVGDRRADNGKLVPGEKTFTPLGFSCSPGLLHPAHRKKIRLMHIVKKSVVPKLTAERLEPPAPPRSLRPSVRPGDTHSISFGPSSPPHSSARMGFLAHRRARSQVSKQPDAAAHDLSKNWEHISSISHTLHATFRRTSMRSRSADYSSYPASCEPSDIPTSGLGHAAPRSGSSSLPTRFSGDIALDRKILPASMLATLLSDSSEPGLVGPTADHASYLVAGSIRPLRPPNHHTRTSMSHGGS